MSTVTSYLFLYNVVGKRRKKKGGKKKVLSKVLRLDCHVQKFGIFGKYRSKVATGNDEAFL